MVVKGTRASGGPWPRVRCRVVVVGQPDIPPHFENVVLLTSVLWDGEARASYYRPGQPKHCTAQNVVLVLALCNVARKQSTTSIATRNLIRCSIAQRLPSNIEKGHVV